MAKRGRPTKYTKALARKICERLAAGESLRAICQDEGMPSEAAVRAWALDDVDGFSAQYEASRNLGLDCMADEVLDIADNDDGDAQSRRLKFDARRWYLSKLAPKRYGDKVAHQHTGENGGPIQYHAILTDQ